MPEISFTLKPSPPFSLEFTAWALRRRLKNEVDRWNGKNYSRIFVYEGKAVKVRYLRRAVSTNRNCML